jgi:cytidine deaminase
LEQRALHIGYKVFREYTDMPEPEASLVRMAFEATQMAYAPYSGFHVGAVALMSNGEMVSGANQENASFPAGICAERVLLSTVSSIYPGESIDTIAITYALDGVSGNHPVAPCGICRQSLVEYEERIQKPFRLIIGGMTGEVFVFESAGSLLPLHFSGKELKA